jgi:hypothetical protein
MIHWGLVCPSGTPTRITASALYRVICSMMVSRWAGDQNAEDGIEDAPLAERAYPPLRIFGGVELLSADDHRAGIDGSSTNDLRLLVDFAWCPQGKG